MTWRQVSRTSVSGSPAPTPVKFPPIWPVIWGAVTCWLGTPSVASCLARPMKRLQPRLNRFCKRSEEHTSELQSRPHLVCRLLLEKKKGTESVLGGVDLDPAIPVVPGPHVPKPVVEGIEASAHDDVATGPRYPRLVKSGEQRSHVH